MSPCEIAIELARDDATYVPGDRIKGTVHVRANQDFEHRRIVLVREWRTHGRGNRDSGGTEEIELAPAAMCRAGDAMELPFDVVAPAGPFTYHGHYLNVDWYVEARADIARARDPKGERELVLVPHDRTLTEYFMGEVALDGTTHAIDSGARLQRKVQNVVFGSVAAFMLIFALGLIISSGLLTGNLDRNNAGGLMIGALLLLLGAALSFKLVRNALAQRRLGAVTLTVTPGQVQPGGSVNVRLHSPAVTDATIDSARLVLVGREVVVRGSGTDRTTHTHVLHEHEIQLVDMPHAVRYGPMDLAGDITLPADAAYSFRASDNRLNWTLSARLSLPGWPDWHEEVELIVRP